MSTPGEPLFEFDARPPTTVEWLGQHAEAHKQRRLKLDLWFVLMGSPLKLARWRWKHPAWRARRPRLTAITGRPVVAREAPSETPPP